MTPISDSARIASNIPRYFVYSMLKGLNFGVVTAIWVIFLQRQYGLSLTEVTLVDVSFWVAATVGEVPTGIVADSVGRKASLAAGAVLMGASMLMWALVPPVPVIVGAYILLAIGVTFLSGAEDALFYESLQAAGRSGEYARLVGRVSATVIASAAVGNLSSGLLATLDLRLPFLLSGLVLWSMVGVVLTFREPGAGGGERASLRPAYGEIVRQSFALARTHPALRFAMAYLALVPVASVVLETVFVQPQAVALGVPLAGLGVVVMVAQLANMVGATQSHRLAARLGEGAVLTAAPVLIIMSLLLLAAFQVIPALSFVAVIGFVTAAMRPVVLARIQRAVPDNIRATILSMQSLVFTIFVAVCEPLLGLAADRSGLPVSYVWLAGGLGLLALLLFWRGRRSLA